MFKRILIATDFSLHANYALKRAILFAKAFDAELYCLHVVNQNWTEYFNNIFLTENKKAIEDYIKKAESLHYKAVKKLRLSHPCEFVVQEGDTSEQILYYAKKYHMDAIFIGAHGCYYLNDFILGTNSEAVIRQAGIPVFLIRKRPSFSYRRILIPIDFSAASKKAVELAYEAYPKAKFLLLHIADVWYEKLLEDRKHRQDLHEEMVQGLERKLLLFLDDCKVKQDRFSIKFAGGYPANDIARYALTWNAHLVVAGVARHSLLHYILIGSINDRLIRINQTDMLFVPH